MKIFSDKHVWMTELFTIENILIMYVSIVLKTVLGIKFIQKKI